MRRLRPHKYLHERAAHRYTLVHDGNPATHGTVLVQLRPDEFQRLASMAPLSDGSAGAVRMATEAAAARRNLPLALEVLGALRRWLGWRQRW